MGTNVLKKVLNITPAFILDLNRYFEAFAGNIITRDSNGNPKENVAMCGDVSRNFDRLLSHRLTMTDGQRELHLDAEESNVSLRSRLGGEVVKVNGNGAPLGKQYTVERSDVLKADENGYLQFTASVPPLGSVFKTIELRGGPVLILNNTYAVFINDKLVKTSGYESAPYYDAGTYTLRIRSFGSGVGVPATVTLLEL
jgi:hypothetical protein